MNAIAAFEHATAHAPPSCRPYHGPPCPRGTFSHVVAYTRQTFALRGTEDSLLDAASYGVRWVQLSPTPASGIAGSRSTPTLTFSLVGGS